jgi:arabinogalactan endo-1,4-beta-galactosidase
LPSHVVPGFPATATGQAAFIAMVCNTVASVPQGRGLGVCYWAPEFVANPVEGSPWENVAGFDFANRALPVLSTLGE